MNTFKLQKNVWVWVDIIDKKLSFQVHQFEDGKIKEEHKEVLEKLEQVTLRTCK